MKTRNQLSTGLVIAIGVFAVLILLASQGVKPAKHTAQRLQSLNRVAEVTFTLSSTKTSSKSQQNHTR